MRQRNSCNAATDLHLATDLNGTHDNDSIGANDIGLINRLLELHNHPAIIHDDNNVASGNHGPRFFDHDNHATDDDHWTIHSNHN